MTENSRHRHRPGPRRARQGLAAVAAALVALEAAPVTAQTLPEGLSGSVTVYTWLPAMDGTASVPGSGLSSAFSAGIGDVLEAFNFGVSGAAELRYGRWGLLNDFIYNDLSVENPTGSPLGTVVKSSISLTMLTVAVGYRVHEADTAFFDVYAGGRYTRSDLTLSLRRPLPAPVSRRANGEASWVDPLVGVRAGVRFAERWSAEALVDLGGFGVGSELTWQVVAGVHYHITPTISADLGLRYMSIDRDGSRVNLDLQMFGPTAGITFAF